MTTSPATRLQLGFAGVMGCDQAHLSVDGMTPAGPNLSHWPGNRTPPQWRADLSTGIALRFSRALAAEQETFLGAARLVVNDHYDSDGFGSLLAVLQPQVAHAHEELLLATAATGDFAVWQTARAFAIDRAIVHVAAPNSPVRAAFAGITDHDELALARYRWLLEHAGEVLTAPEVFAPVYADEMALVRGQIDAGLRGAIARRCFASVGFTALTTRTPQHRMTLNTLAGTLRVLHVQEGQQGARYRFHDRTESWFDMVTVAPLPRRDLRALATTLGQLEAPRDGACWHADPPTEPIPELYFGMPAAQAYGQDTRELRPSSLPAEQVLAAFVRFFAAAG